MAGCSDWESKFDYQTLVPRSASKCAFKVELQAQTLQHFPLSCFSTPSKQIGYGTNIYWLCLCSKVLCSSITPDVSTSSTKHNCVLVNHKVQQLYIQPDDIMINYNATKITEVSNTIGGSYWMKQDPCSIANINIEDIL